MTHVSTYFIREPGGIIVEIRFYTTTQKLNRGLWNIHTNEILLTEVMYEEWRTIRSKSESSQKCFFDKLEKISDFALPDQNPAP